MKIVIDFIFPNSQGSIMMRRSCLGVEGGRMLLLVRGVRGEATSMTGDLNIKVEEVIVSSGRVEVVGAKSWEEG